MASDSKPSLAPLPASLYKYRSLDRATEILSTNRLYFSSPADFNDPFDCKVGPLGLLDQDFLREMIRVRSLLGGGKPSPAEERLAHGDADAYKEVSKQVQARVDQHRVLCFSEPRENILLWSHYAESHRGICLEFSTEKWSALIHNALPVRYSHQRPSEDFTHEAWDQMKFVSNIALIKDSCWRYEKERRFIREPGSGLVDFPPEALTGVIFGCEFPDQKYDAVMDLVTRRVPRPAIYKAVRHDRKFALVIEQIREPGGKPA